MSSMSRVLNGFSYLQNVQKRFKHFIIKGVQRTVYHTVGGCRNYSPQCDGLIKSSLASRPFYELSQCREKKKGITELSFFHYIKKKLRVLFKPILMGSIGFTCGMHMCTNSVNYRAKIAILANTTISGILTTLKIALMKLKPSKQIRN